MEAIIVSGYNLNNTSLIYRDFILELPKNKLSTIYSYIQDSKPIPDFLLRNNSHMIRHMIILFYEYFYGDSVNFKLGFRPELLEEHNITLADFEKNFEHYLDLSSKGIVVIIDNQDKSVALLSIELSNSLHNYTKIEE